MKRFYTYLLMFLLAGTSVSMAQSSSNGFNYQGVARDADGEVLSNINLLLEVSLYSDADQIDLLWREGHSITTNEFGVFATVIGQGITTGDGDALSFRSIDFSNTDVHIMIQVDYGKGLQELGFTKLQSVPYAKYAEKAYSVVGELRKLKDLEDVEADAIANNQILKWNGKRFVVADSAVIEYFNATGNVIIGGSFQMSNGVVIDSIVNTLSVADSNTIVDAKTIKTYIDLNDNVDSSAITDTINNYKAKMVIDSTMFSDRSY